MNKISQWTKQGKLALLLTLFVAVGLLVGGCGGGSDSYDEPRDTNTTPVNGAATDVLVDAATVKSWIDSGLVNNEEGFDKKVVILDYAAYNDETITSPRIPGACRVTRTELDKLRFEGVGTATPLVADGEMMDAVIQRLGIDEDTTIVFTTSGSAYYATRAYWIFRYWGFPKDRLKLLDGGQAAFAADYPDMMTEEVPSPEPSTYSVRNLPELNDDLRASVSEIVTIIKGLESSDSDVVLDARGSAFYSGTRATSGLVSSGVVVVDGHPVGGQYLSQGDLFTDGKFKSADEIKALFEAKGWAPGKKVTVYCTSGYSATPLFFALDAILDTDVQLHDGSWSQLGRYSDSAANGGDLPAGSVWAIDNYLDPATRTYNKYAYVTPLLIETLKASAAVDPQAAPFTGNNPLNDDDVVQSQVEAADAAYADGSGMVTISAPMVTATPNVLIEAEWLQAWKNQGLLDVAPGAGERVVLLDVTSAANYAAGHIPGALLWDIAGQAVERTEGPAPAVNMVLDGAAMDARLQALGIDENTTIVFTSTSGNRSFYPGRAYFTFRYWGWPKDRLKVLNGFNSAWSTLTTDVPTVTPSTLSVADLAAGAQLDTRVSLAELMDAVRDERGTAIDFRGDASAIGSTAGVFGDVSGDYVVFEGRIKGGTYYSYADFQVSGSDRFKPAYQIRQELIAAGIDIDSFSTDGSYVNPVYSLCRTAYIASTGFFVLDAILGVDVMTYDGSWSQWGKMSADASVGGELPAGSEWAVDNATYMSLINYNVNNPTNVIVGVNPDADALLLDPADAEANQVENEDADYRDQAPATSTPDAGSGGSAPTPGGGGAPVGC